MLEEDIMNYYKVHGYIPAIFTPYSHGDATRIASTICTECGSPGHQSNMIAIVKEKLI